MQRLNKRQAAIIGAYTGTLAGPVEDLNDYIAEIMGRRLFTHELADEKMQHLVAERSRDDFLAICALKTT